MDEQRRELPSGERGEIIIAGPNVSPGYLNRPELNETAFFHLNGQSVPTEPATGAAAARQHALLRGPDR